MPRPDEMDTKLLTLAKRAMKKHGRVRSTMGYPRTEIVCGPFHIRMWEGANRLTVFREGPKPRGRNNLISVWTIDLDTLEVAETNSPFRGEIIDRISSLLVLDLLSEI